MRSLLVGTIAILIASTLAFAQGKPKSDKECIKEVPGDWGPNFGDEWHHHEALYWACRIGVSGETVKHWQDAAGEMDMAQDIQLVKVGGQELVIFEEMGGTAHCFDVKVLQRVGKTWKKVWSLPGSGGEYCTGQCPSLKTILRDNILTVESPVSSDPSEDISQSCPHVTWRRERFRWNGQGFDPLLEGTNGRP